MKILDEKKLKFTVAVCTYNRFYLLDKSLKSLCSQNYPSKYFEILVIDNNSTDLTKTVTKKIMKDYPEINIRYKFEAKQGISYASNTALKSAKYPIVIFLDDDEIASKNFLINYNKVWSKYGTSKVGSVGGKIGPWFENKIAKDLYNKHKNLVGSWVFGIIDLGKKELILEDKLSLLAGNFSLNKEIVLSLGGFDTKIGVKKWPFYIQGDDIELCLRLKKFGYYLIYSPKIIVKNFVPVCRFNKRYLLRRYFLSSIEMQYVDKKIFGRKYVLITSLNLIKKHIRYFYRFISFRKSVFNPFQVIWDITYTIQTILTILK